MRTALVGLVLLSLAGCSVTVVKPVRTGREKGVRVYVTKPYLLIQPDDTKPGKVVLTIEYLPDVTQQLAIQPKVGIGKNHTTVTLNDNGTLQSLDADVDSNFAENVKALTAAVSALPKPAGAEVPNKNASPPTMRDGKGICVTAHRVPIGLYDAVVSTDPTCQKKIYGWRYLGFAPFSQCPLDISGGVQADCSSEVLYGLVTDKNGDLVFCALNELAIEPVEPGDVKMSASASLDVHREQLLGAIGCRLAAAGSAFRLSSDDLLLAYNKSSNRLEVMVENVPTENDKTIIERDLAKCVQVVYRDTHPDVGFSVNLKKE